MSSRVRAQVRFAQIPEWLLYAPDVSAQAVRVYGVLLRVADRGSRFARARHATIAAKAGEISVATVKRAIDELLALGAVEVVHRTDALGQHANDYFVRAIPREAQGSLLDNEDEASEPGGSPVNRGQLTEERGVTDDLGPQLTGDLARRSSESLSVREKTSPTAKSPTKEKSKIPRAQKPTHDSVYLADRINERWSSTKGRLTPPALQLLVARFGARDVEDALRELHGFPPQEAVRSPYAYLEAMLTDRAASAVIDATQAAG